ncbi:MAG: 50S ribosome-binding GTPase, partial [Candidatus Hydrogenedentes bacterium]|nr:50S ribosome-binding GTPase [Candidatus Hydrogenedentota bacterium]
NAGKSTLLNPLTNRHLTAENALFATLNPVSRRIRFPQEREVIITDTVGFIRDLPKELKAAFRTTFEELQDADILLHVMDSSCPDLEDKYEAVQKLLRELELDEKPTYHVLNKQDKCDRDTLHGLTERFDGIPLCALHRDTFSDLLNRMEADLWSHDLTPASWEE